MRNYDIIRAVYATRIGNIPAKSLLAYLAKRSDSNGASWPSPKLIVQETEIAERTVQRVIEVFVKIGLIKKEHNLGDYKSCKGFRIVLSRLNQDLSAEFVRHYREACRKLLRGDKARLCDTSAVVTVTPGCVVETASSVGETPFGVAETTVSICRRNIEGTSNEELKESPSNPRSIPASSLSGSSLHRSDSRSADEIIKPRINSPEEVAEAVLDELKLAGSFTKKAVVEVARLEIRAGADPEALRSRMVKAVQDYENNVTMLERPIKMETFFGDGMWRNCNLWPWDKEKVGQYQAASCGSRHESNPQDIERDNHAIKNWELLEEHDKWQEAKVDEELSRRYPGDELDKKLRATGTEYWSLPENRDLRWKLTDRQRRNLLLQQLRRSISQEIKVDFEAWQREFSAKASTGNPQDQAVSIPTD